MSTFREFFHQKSKKQLIIILLLSLPVQDSPARQVFVAIFIRIIDMSASTVIYDGESFPPTTINIRDI